MLTFMGTDVVQKPEAAHVELEPIGRLHDPVAARLMIILADTLYARAGGRISV